MMEMSSSVWPGGHEYIRALVTTGYLISCCTLSAFLSKRITSWSALKALSFARLLVIAVLMDSFLFVFTSAILVIGIGTSFNQIACQVGIWWCIFLYATSKICIYLFLMERVHLVFGNTAGGQVSRLKSPWYRVAMAFFTLWIGVAIAMIVGRIAYIRPDHACMIGLKLYATVPMLTVDAIVNLFLTTAFVVPIYKSRFGKAQTLARNSIIAATAALITSFVNICILAIQDGKQLSWVCLGSCGMDVTINATIIYAITSNDRKEDPMTATAGTMDSRRGARRSSAYPGSYFPGGPNPAPIANAFPNFNFAPGRTMNLQPDHTATMQSQMSSISQREREINARNHTFQVSQTGTRGSGVNMMVTQSVEIDDPNQPVSVSLAGEKDDEDLTEYSDGSEKNGRYHAV
ncbi:hypothetical protein T439DRAFT_324733 [Meredithblackwellia eburnea MCA 4105]